MAHTVGETVILDGIESLIIYDAGSNQDWGRYLCTDKNHDLVWYFDGTDYEDEDEPSTVINTVNKYGYEWGGFGTTTGITDQSIGAGLTNTNTLIGMNLQPNTSDWYVIWDKVEEFRNQIGSDKWFVPSLDELNLIRDSEFDLKGLTANINFSALYWSSSEGGSETAEFQNLASGLTLSRLKYYHNLRVRLCRYTTDNELKSVSISCTTPDVSIYYTYDKTTPTEESSLYSQSVIAGNTTIKARAYKEGWLESDIATQEVN